MRSIHKNTIKPIKKVFIVVSIVIALAAIYTATAYALKVWPFNTSSQKIEENSSHTPTEQQPDSTNTATDNNQVNDSKSNAIKDTPSSSSSASPKSIVTITAANQDKQADLLRIRTLISGVEGSGTCNLTLTKETSVITATSGIQAGPSSSTCQGFDISISNQLSVGTWDIEIVVNAGSIQTSATGKVTIQ